MSLFMKVDFDFLKNVYLQDWIIGFIEGEGSFRANNIYPCFGLSQSDIFPLLILKQFFGVGSIYYVDNNHTWYYQVNGRNCWIPRNFCEGRLVSRRRKRQFKEWKKLRWMPLHLDLYQKFKEKLSVIDNTVSKGEKG